MDLYNKHDFSSQRNELFDIYKIFALTIVYFTHFTAFYDCVWREYWNNTVGLYGLIGTLGVAIFCVSVGYFSYRDGDFLRYIIRRYLYFFYCILLVNLITIFSQKYYINGHDLYCGFVSAIKLDDSIWPTGWCMPYFLIGTVLCFLNKKAQTTTLELILQILLLTLIVDYNHIWIAICLMGAIIRKINDAQNDKESSNILLINIVVWIICFRAIQLRDNFVNGIAISVALYTQMNSWKVSLKKFFGLIVAILGKNCMGFYLLHTIIYKTIGKLMFSFEHYNTGRYQFVVMIVGYLITWFFAIPVNHILYSLSVRTERAFYFFKKSLEENFKAKQSLK